jgi:hypothetical protein
MRNEYHHGMGLRAEEAGHGAGAVIFGWGRIRVFRNASLGALDSRSLHKKIVKALMGRPSCINVVLQWQH